jgi:hypothetical protein
MSNMGKQDLLFILIQKSLAFNLCLLFLVLGLITILMGRSCEGIKLLFRGRVCQLPKFDQVFL